MGARTACNGLGSRACGLCWMCASHPPGGRGATGGRWNGARMWSAAGAAGFCRERRKRGTLRRTKAARQGCSKAGFTPPSIRPHNMTAWFGRGLSPPKQIYAPQDSKAATDVKTEPQVYIMLFCDTVSTVSQNISNIM